MADVKAAEISAILKQQLSGFESTASLDEVELFSMLGMELFVHTDFQTQSTENWFNLTEVLKGSFLTLKKTMLVLYF